MEKLASAIGSLLAVLIALAFVVLAFLTVAWYISKHLILSLFEGNMKVKYEVYPVTNLTTYNMAGGYSLHRVVNNGDSQMAHFNDLEDARFAAKCFERGRLGSWMTDWIRALFSKLGWPDAYATYAIWGVWILAVLGLIVIGIFVAKALGL